MLLFFPTIFCRRKICLIFDHIYWLFVKNCDYKDVFFVVFDVSSMLIFWRGFVFGGRECFSRFFVVVVICSRASGSSMSVFMNFLSTSLKRVGLFFISVS